MSEQNLREKLYKEISERLGLKAREKKNLKWNTARTIRVYKLFMKIGREKLERMKETQPSNVLRLNDEECNKIIKRCK
ncbi:hypothetical protein RCL_jg21706.t1 [Rhizophagus clarus]|uniref:Uncharacterized protein n=1 Tax=Rhizophagus clarus TaxID=94130 RepID=A0A8H3L2M8_9GLOM|nr:hypothetical protein RCL_jg21706.t1 [Rhizophagus clarus]